jgi:hypothetical protein
VQTRSPITSGRVAPGHRAVFRSHHSDFVAAIRLRDKSFRRAFGTVQRAPGSSPRTRHHSGVAITALAAQCEHYVAIALVTDRATQATAGSWRPCERIPGSQGLWAGCKDVGKRLLWISQMRHCSGAELDSTPDPAPRAATPSTLASRHDLPGAASRKTSRWPNSLNPE